MYSLDFIDYLESVKEKTLQIQKEYILRGQKMLDMQKDMTEMIERLEQINDVNSQAFKKMFKECENAENEYRDILTIYEELEKKLEEVKEYVKIKLKSNKEVLEKYNNTVDKEDKYIKLLGGKTAQERILQFEKALKWLEEDYRIDKFQEIYTVFEKILGIERQKPQIKFEAKTAIYSYIDELGNEMKYDFFDRTKDGKLNSEINDIYLQSIVNIAKERGLSNRQIKKIDLYIATILEKENLDMFYNYIEVIKNDQEMKFIISYDLRTDRMRKEDILTKEELNKIKKYAMRQKLIGIANILRDKSRIMMIMRFLGGYLITGIHYENAITEGNNIKL